MFILLGLLSLVFSAQKCELLLMSVNLENFFDSTSNQRLGDWSYPHRKQVPIGKKGLSVEWTPELFQQKTAQALKFIKKLKPDALALNEIENPNVALKIAPAGPYDTLHMTQGSDARGINSAFLGSLPKGVEIVGFNLLDVHGKSFPAHPTRQILELHLYFEDTEETLVLLICHWPAKLGPTIARNTAAETVRSRIRDLSEKDKNLKFLAMGDFNVTEVEDEGIPHPFRDILCNPKDPYHLVDVHEEANIGGLPPGTYFYQPRVKSKPATWNRFDRFLASPNLLGDKGLRIELSSYQIAVIPEFMKTVTFEGKKIQVPMGFEEKKGKGLTDHLPILLKLRWD